MEKCDFLCYNDVNMNFGDEMSYKNILDMHIHSDSSPDAHHSVSLLCEHAVKRGVRGVAITDHCECNAFYRDGYNITYVQSLFETAKARTIFEGQLTVLLGVELGQPTLDINIANKIVSRSSLDFVLASMHNLRDRQDFYHLDYKKAENDPKILLREYFDELIATVKWGDFDSLAHLTYPLRYITGRDGIEVDLKEYDEQINFVFKGLIESGKALEINTSGLRDALNATLPEFELVKRFRDMGGEFITIGSDAHSAGNVGDGIDIAMTMAKDAGFEHITLYKQRTPVPISIK